MSEFTPISCDCLIQVETSTYLKKCRLHFNSRNVRDCYMHNVLFSEPLKTEIEARAERERIRRL